MEFTFKSHDGTPRRFSPVRDIAYFTPELLSALKGLLEEKLNAEDTEYLGDDYNKLAEGYARLCLFTSNAITPEIKNPLDAIKATGFLDLPASVRRVILEKFCIVMLGAFWSGIRSSVVLEEPVPLTIQGLKATGIEFLKSLNKP